MRTVVLSTFLLVFLGVASCGPNDASKGRSPGPKAVEAVPPPLPRTPGTYVHTGSGIQFPKDLGDFLRMSVRPYGQDGADIGVGYLWKKDRSAVVTVYVYPRPLERRGVPRPFEKHFALELIEVRRDRPDIKEIGRGVSQGNLGGHAVEGSAVEFEFSGGPEFGGARVRSVISVFALPSWLVKYRITCPAGRRDKTLASVERLLAVLGFPPLGVQTRVGPVGQK